MASIGRDSGGRKRILFVAENGKRRTVRLGKCSQKQAEAAKVKIEALIAAQFTPGNMDDEVSRWLAALPDNMHRRLVAVGLAKPRVANSDASASGWTLSRFLDEYKQSRVDVKPGTKLTYGRTCQYLLGHFTVDKLLSEISEGDADAWRLHLFGQGLAVSTVNRASCMARQFFRSAVRRKLIVSNPFADLESAVKSNKAREFFLSRESIDKIIAACPNITPAANPDMCLCSLRLPPCCGKPSRKSSRALSSLSPSTVSAARI